MIVNVLYDIGNNNGYSCNQWISTGLESNITYPVVDDNDGTSIADNFSFVNYPTHVIVDHDRVITNIITSSNVQGTLIPEINELIAALPQSYGNFDEITNFYVSDNSSSYNLCYPPIGTLEAPLSSIQMAINFATDGDVVQLFPGSYAENLNFLGKNFTLKGDGSNNTFIIGDSISTVMFNSGEDSLALLTDLTITRSDTIDTQVNGGGVFIENSSPTLDNVVITGNHGAELGGGIYLYNSNATFNDVDITLNSSTSEGGGVYMYFSNPALNGLDVSDNNGGSAGGGLCITSSSNPIISNALISGNYATEGGGIYSTFGSNLSLSYLEVSTNTAVHGAGMYIRSSEAMVSDLVLTSNSSDIGGGIYNHASIMSILGGSVYSNTVSDHGGGIYMTANATMDIERIQFYDNTSPLGAALFIDGSNANITNVTITENASEILSTGTGGGIYCNNNANAILKNTIVWNNAPDQMAFSPSNDPSTVTVSYSDIDGGTSNIVTNGNVSLNWLNGNINQDPMFVNTSSKNFNLQYGSPAIDAGDPQSGLDPDGTIPDLGAFYFNSGLLGDVTFVSNSFYFITSTSGVTNFEIPISNTGNVELDYTITVDATIANYTWITTVSNGQVPIAETEYIMIDLEELDNLEPGTYTGSLYFGTNTGSNPDIMISNTDTVDITLELVDNTFLIEDTTATIESGNIDPILLLNESILLDFFSSNGGSVMVRSIPSQAQVDQTINVLDPDGELVDPIFPDQYFEITESLEGEYWTDIGLSYGSLQGIDSPGELRLAKRVSNAGSGVAWDIIPINQTQLDTSIQMVIALDQTSFSQWSLISDSSKNSFSDREGPIVSNISFVPLLPSHGTDVTVAATITDHSGVSEAQLHYGQAGDWNYSTGAMSANGDTFSYSIPGQYVTFHGLSFFIDSKDQNQYSSISDTIHHEVHFDDGVITTANVQDAAFSVIAPNVWRLISLPSIPDDPAVELNLGDELGQPDSLVWRIFSFEDSAYVSNPVDLNAGEGYWLYHRSDNSLLFDMSSGRTGDLSGTSLNVKAGQWAFIGSPYSFSLSIDLDQSVFYGPITYGLINEGWTDIVNTLQPWSGYAVYNRSDADQTIELDPLNGISVQTAKLDTEVGWKVRLMASSGIYNDIYNRIGCSEYAEDAIDYRDNPELKAPGSSVSLSFVVPENENDRFTSDIRAMNDDVKIFDARI